MLLFVDRRSIYIRVLERSMSLERFRCFFFVHHLYTYTEIKQMRVAKMDDSTLSRSCVGRLLDGSNKATYEMRDLSMYAGNDVIKGLCCPY